MSLILNKQYRDIKIGSAQYNRFRIEKTHICNGSCVYKVKNRLNVWQEIFESFNCKNPPSKFTVKYQGWEFAHRFSERIARFLRKNERMSDSLKKTSNLLISSFLVSDLSEPLMVANFC